MRLQSIILENFRAYKEKITIEIGDLTAFIGKNDYGKSTILEALEIFFNSTLVKIDADDPNKRSDSRKVRIGCCFDELPNSIVLDEISTTSLEQEFLLNESGCLEIHKVFNCGANRISPKIFAIANHPTAQNANDLLQLKNTALKNRLNELGIDNHNIDRRSNPEIRQAIWNHIRHQDLELQEVPIPLDTQESRKIWEKIERYLPAYALFKADRPSTDTDAEVQDPMKFAIRQAIKSVESKLDEIKAEVRREALDVANRTLQKLNEMAPELSNELNPTFSAEPRWDGFKLTFTGEDDIPINKRGSGVRRLILLNFFRAEAERRASEENRPKVIYAVEEPEVSQHPENQEMLVNALLDLSSQDNHQVILTTHVPRLAGLLPIESIRHISRNDEGLPIVRQHDEDVFKRVMNELGVLPNPDELVTKRDGLKLLICVEGTSDVAFLKKVSCLIRKEYPELSDLESDARVAVIPLYGTNLKTWVENHYLRGTGVLELHIYDRDEDNKYKSAKDKVNSRNDGSRAMLTERLNIESYFHVCLINEVFQINLNTEQTKDKDCDVIQLVVDEVKKKQKKHEIRKKVIESSHKNWKANAKKHLHTTALDKLTLRHIEEADPDGEIKGWLTLVTCLLEKSHSCP